MYPSLPSRASDAGPDTRDPEPPLTWRDHVDTAADELRDSWRLSRDSPALERKLRLECLDRAMTEIAQAMVLLAGNDLVAPQKDAELVATLAAAGCTPDQVQAFVNTTEAVA